MLDPELYQNSNNLSRRDAHELLSEYSKKITWKNTGERVIDVGSADGGILANIYTKYLPSNYAVLIGSDLSKNMVDFANVHHGSEKIKFIQLDIEKKLPEELKSGFDHVFSFYILHWLRNQKAAFQNFFDLLAENGECLVTGMANLPVYDICRILSKNHKWSRWLTTVEEYVSPYHESQDAANEITNLMEETGFRNVEVTCKPKSYIFESIKELKDMMRAVSSFPIPPDLYPEYLEDFVEVIQDTKLMDIVTYRNGKPDKIKITYNVITAYGCK